ncbi:lysylphosphatidylglycerol synthase domain-containing protein [Pseudomonas sp. MDMC216]|nr:MULTISPECIES: lysylphosphatidylglycerol synthase domain-containing protein [unclassified Pseudomonas]MDI5993286.1 lysylphosphatidylglycerol synthase domain-containing protein [Pseudomonas sp. MDMC216]MDI6006677.1 lysylphosphatidylglycerol synthase domain-containing protein [Pseudomonas sp. MDMC17]PTC01080.1 hypothetical protein C9975_04030 [Thalassospira xiamenensis]RAR32209.1 hypothetical protein DP092_19375 [Pseudomonas sp. MDMC224]
MIKISKKTVLVFFSLLLLAIAFWAVGDLRAVYKAISLFEVQRIVVVALLFLITIVLSFLRVWIIFRDFGRRLSFIGVVRACVAGNIGALFFMPMFGQIAGRQFYLSRLGVSAIENSAVSGYERVVAGAVSAFFAAIGFLYLYGWRVVEGAGLVNLVIFVVASVVALFVYFRLIAVETEKRLVTLYLSWRNIFLLSRVALVVALGMVLMMMCFALMFSVALPEADYLEVVSVAFIVSFLASLPISFGGWGLREVSSMSFVAYLGGAAEAGLAASLFIGLTSMAVVLMCSPVLLINRSART